jgi:hypothetical protein
VDDRALLALAGLDRRAVVVRDLEGRFPRVIRYLPFCFSGPWQEKQDSLKMGYTSRVKSTFRATGRGIFETSILAFSAARTAGAATTSNSNAFMLE